MEKKQDLEDDLNFNDDLTKLRSSLLYKAHKIYKADRLNGAWSFNGKAFIKDAKDEKHEVKAESSIDGLSSKRPIVRKKDEPTSATPSSPVTY